MSHIRSSPARWAATVHEVRSSALGQGQLHLDAITRADRRCVPQRLFHRQHERLPPRVGNHRRRPRRRSDPSMDADRPEPSPAVGSPRFDVVGHVSGDGDELPAGGAGVPPQLRLESVGESCAQRTRIRLLRGLCSSSTRPSSSRSGGMYIPNRPR